MCKVGSVYEKFGKFYEMIGLSFLLTNCRNACYELSCGVGWGHSQVDS